MTEKLHLVGSCGASKAVTGLAAVYWTLAHLLGWTPDDFASMGSSSGAGVIQAIICGGKLTIDQVLDLMLRTNLAAELDFRRTTRAERLRIALRHQRAEVIKPWPQQALVNSERLGEFIDSLVSGPWPPALWIVGADGDGLPVLFNKDGVSRWTARGCFGEPIPTVTSVGTAVRASCSIPLLFTPPQVVVGDDLVPVWDGAFACNNAFFGLCPVQVPINHLKAPASQVLALDVSEEPSHHGLTGMLRRGYRHCCGIHDPIWPDEAQDVIRIAPSMPFSAMNLGLSLDQKWQGIAIAMTATIKTLIQRTLVPEEAMPLARRVLNVLEPYLRAHLGHNVRAVYSADLRHVLDMNGFRLSA